VIANIVENDKEEEFPSASQIKTSQFTYEITGLQIKFAPPLIRPPQQPPNDLHFFWLIRVDLGYYWSFNSFLPKNNIEYPQTGPPLSHNKCRRIFKT
jgi:hypothetical protein